MLKVAKPITAQSQRCISPHTIKAYRTSLELLFDFVKCEKGIGLGDITSEILTNQMIVGFLDWLETSRGSSIATRN